MQWICHGLATAVMNRSEFVGGFGSWKRGRGEGRKIDHGSADRSPVSTGGKGIRLPASTYQDNPTISPFSSMSMCSAAGADERPGMVRMSPQMG
jgi:hypothetical protein